MGCGGAEEDSSDSITTEYDSLNDTEEDSSDSITTEYDSLNDTDVCMPVEQRIELCGAATTQQECGTASSQLPPDECDCVADCSSSCSWVPVVPTSLSEDGCAFGDVEFRCFYTGSGENSYSAAPPCDPALGFNDNATFLFEEAGDTFIGYFWASGVSAPESTHLQYCDMELRQPETCSCLCDAAYPVQDLGDF
jgi:hypothetical protein